MFQTLVSKLLFINGIELIVVLSVMNDRENNKMRVLFYVFAVAVSLANRC